jgi:hypothetical protein
MTPEMRNKMRNQANKPNQGSALRDKFKAQKNNLLKRHQEQVDNKDQGNEFPTVFDKGKIPKGIGFWRPEKGEHIIDIIPHFAGSQNPRVSEGELAYVVDFWVHLNVGPLRTPYCCSAKNFKKSDPICEYVAKNRLDTDEWKKVSAKRRTAYLVWVHDDDKEEAKGLQIWEVAHFYFEEKIDEIAKAPRGGGAVAFSDIDSGKSIAFTSKVTGSYEDGSGKKRDSIGLVGHKFIDRDKEIPNKILEQIFPLDEVILMHPDNAEIEEAFYGSSEKQEKTDPEEETCDVCDKFISECECTGSMEDDDIPFDTGKASQKRSKPEPEQEEENDVNPEEMDNGIDNDPDPENETLECPHDPDSFGEVDEHPECEADGGCPLWDECSDESVRLKKEAEAKAKAGTKKPIASSANKKKIIKK